MVRHKVHGKTVQKSTKMNIVEIEKLIIEVEARPVLWNVSLKEYRNVLLRNKAWDKVAELLRCDVTAARNKWRYLRDMFSKQMKTPASGSCASAKRPWPYTVNMMFLRDTVTPRRSSPNPDSDIEYHSISNINDGDSTVLGNTSDDATYVALASSKSKHLQAVDTANLSLGYIDHRPYDNINFKGVTNSDLLEIDPLFIPGCQKGAVNKSKEKDGSTNSQKSKRPKDFHLSDVTNSPSQDFDHMFDIETESGHKSKKKKMPPPVCTKEFQTAIVDALNDTKIDTSSKPDFIEMFLMSQYESIKRMRVELQEKTKLEIQQIVYNNTILDNVDAV